MTSYQLIDGFAHLCYNEVANEQNGAFCFLALPSIFTTNVVSEAPPLCAWLSHVPLFVGTTASTMEAFCMVTILVEDILDKELCHVDYEDCRIYIFRDKDLVLYIGQSKDVIRRLKEHLGFNVRGFGIKESNIGRLVNANVPESKQWEIDLLTLEDCKTYTVFTIPAENVDWAEAELISLLCPCLNQHLNRRYNRDSRLRKYNCPWVRKVTDEMLSFLSGV